MSKKPYPEKVDASIGYRVLRQDGERQSSWTRYIIAHFDETGNLAPGCDARDWFAWYDMHANMGALL